MLETTIMDINYNLNLNSFNFMGIKKGYEKKQINQFSQIFETHFSESQLYFRIQVDKTFFS